MFSSDKFIVKLLVFWQVYKYMKDHTFVFMAELFFDMQQLEYYGFKIGFPLEQERLLRQILIFKNSYGSKIFYLNKILSNNGVSTADIPGKDLQEK